MIILLDHIFWDTQYLLHFWVYNLVLIESVVLNNFSILQLCLELLCLRQSAGSSWSVGIFFLSTNSHLGSQGHPDAPCGICWHYCNDALLNSPTYIWYLPFTLSECHAAQTHCLMPCELSHVSLIRTEQNVYHFDQRGLKEIGAHHPRE